MSRYVDKPHGLTIGSGNVFFFRNEENEFKEFPAIITVKGYNFENFSILQAGIRTPAEQLLFKPVQRKGDFDFEETYYRPKSWVTKWLDEYAPGWGCPPLANADRTPTLFFRTRKDALAFAAMVKYQLDGMEFL